jgi:hypothetical protein
MIVGKESTHVCGVVICLWYAQEQGQTQLELSSLPYLRWDVDEKVNLGLPRVEADCPYGECSTDFIVMA